jgi:hypothetical protein
MDPVILVACKVIFKLARYFARKLSPREKLHLSGIGQARLANDLS